jgi:hypothetical protein
MQSNVHRLERELGERQAVIDKYHKKEEEDRRQAELDNESHKGQLETILEQIEAELEGQRNNMEHQWRVMSYSETLMEDLERKREEETRRMREDLVMSKRKRLEGLLESTTSIDTESKPPPTTKEYSESKRLFGREIVKVADVHPSSVISSLL